MKILVLSKRRYTNKDLIDDRYGRLFEIPAALKASNEVAGFCVSYQNNNEGKMLLEKHGATLVWYSYNLGRTPLAIHRLKKHLYAAIKQVQPDIIWASSDMFNVILGVALQKKYQIPCCADLYDNYESFGASRLPLVKGFFRKAVKKAQGVTAVSDTLAVMVKDRYGLVDAPVVIRNGISKDLFQPLDKAACREQLGISASAHVIGTAGSLYQNRGIGTLFSAFEGLVQSHKDLHLLLAGPLDKQIQIPNHPNVVYLGNVDYEKVPVIYNALDVGIVCNRANAFGEYCFPQKFFEMLSCAIPVISASIGDVAGLLRDYPQNLYQPDSTESLIKAIRHQLEHKVIPAVSIPDWRDLAGVLQDYLNHVIR